MEVKCYLLKVNVMQMTLQMTSQAPTQIVFSNSCFFRPTAYFSCVNLCQCPKLSFYFVHSQGALPKKLCTRKLLHAPSQYIAIINGSENVHTQGAHLLKSCTRLWKCALWVKGAPLISDTVCDMCMVLRDYNIHKTDLADIVSSFLQQILQCPLHLESGNLQLEHNRNSLYFDKISKFPVFSWGFSLG